MSSIFYIRRQQNTAPSGCIYKLNGYGNPVPGIPDRQPIEHEADSNQEPVISGRVSGQTDEIENKKESSHDDVRPAICRIVKDHRQDHHYDGKHHQDSNTQPHGLCEFGELLLHFLSLDVAAEDSQDVT